MKSFTRHINTYVPYYIFETTVTVYSKLIYTNTALVLCEG